MSTRLRFRMGVEHLVEFGEDCSWMGIKIRREEPGSKLQEGSAFTSHLHVHLQISKRINKKIKIYHL